MSNDVEKSNQKQIKTVRVSLAIEKIIIDSLDQYIENGDGWDIIRDSEMMEQTSTIDISRAGLIRFLISAYGCQVTDESNYIYNKIKEQDLPMGYTSIHTKNKRLIEMKGIAKKLVNAMVYIGIPIEGLFDSRVVVKEK